MQNITACMSVDWEGEDLDGAGALCQFNEQFPKIPITHFVSAAYPSRTKDVNDYPANTTEIVEKMTSAVKETDEVALHLHCWKSLSPYTDGASVSDFEEEEEEEEKLTYADQTYRDSGFNTALPSLSTEDMTLLFNNSMASMAPLLKALQDSYQDNYTINGFKERGWLADDKVFRVLQSAKGLVYDASAVDWQLRKRASRDYVFAFSLWSKRSPNYGDRTRRPSHGGRKLS